MKHFNVVADPATHSKKETYVSVVYSWEQEIAAFGDVQLLHPGNVVLPDEQDLPDRLAVLAAQRRLERVATFRQLQACSNTLAALTHRRISLDSFLLPEDVRVRPVKESEVRIVQPEGEQDVAYLYNTETRVALRMLPPEFRETYLLVQGLDQGSIGTAGHAFTEDAMGSLSFTKWCKFHRVIRDWKLACQHTAGGLFRKAELYSSYLWAVNRRPFSTGAFGEQKRRLANVFSACETRDGRLWRKYGHLIAADMGLPFTTDEEQQTVWDRVLAMESFNKATEAPKLGRWFSWNAQAAQMLPEYHAQKMLFEFHIDEEDPDMGVPFDDLRAAASARTQQQQFARLKSTAGGLKLCYLLMTSMLLRFCKVMYVVSQPIWTWYADQVKHVKSPAQSLKRLIIGPDWSVDKHLIDTIKFSLYDESKLMYMGIVVGDTSEGARNLVNWVLDLTVCLLGHRAWSQASRESLPPEEYKGLLSRVTAHQEAAMATLRGTVPLS